MYQKLLRLTNDSADDKEWLKVLEGMDVTTVHSLAEAFGALGAGAFDCVLVCRDVPDGSGFEALELVHSVDAALPVVFWNPEMCAAETVRLIRAGAYHCLGYRDSLEALRDWLENAMEERRGRKRAADRASQSEPWRSLLVGESAAMQAVVETIRLIGGRAAPF